MPRASYLQWDDEDARPLDELLGAAVTYRIAVGPAYGDHRPFDLCPAHRCPIHFVGAKWPDVRLKAP